MCTKISVTYSKFVCLKYCPQYGHSTFGYKLNISLSPHVKVRDDMLHILPSEAEISLSEVNKSCRARLVHPSKPESSHRNGNAPLMPVKALICFILLSIQLQ